MLLYVDTYLRFWHTFHLTFFICCDIIESYTGRVTTTIITIEGINKKLTVIAITLIFVKQFSNYFLSNMRFDKEGQESKIGRNCLHGIGETMFVQRLKDQFLS